MSEAVRATARVLERAAGEHEGVVVAYSDGKDSRVVMDLALRAGFRRVHAFFMEFIPGLRCVDDSLQQVEQRLSAVPCFQGPILRYPHWLLRRCLVDGVYTRGAGETALPAWKLHDVYALARHDTQTELVLTGAKGSDSAWRRRMMGNWGTRGDVAYPIAKWNRLQVEGYLRTRGIEIPASSGKSATGIDLSEPSLLWLHDTFPDDFERLCKVFPFARAVVKRREFFGVREAA